LGAAHPQKRVRRATTIARRAAAAQDRGQDCPRPAGYFASEIGSLLAAPGIDCLGEIQAMACGTPVIAFARGSVAEARWCRQEA
jgi:hypothetical protein